MKKVDSKIEKMLLASFPVLGEDLIIKRESDGTLPYNSKAISIFDHWLSEEDASVYCKSYQTAEDKDDYLLQENVFSEFLESIYDKYDFYLYYNDSDKLVFFSPEGKESLLSAFRLGLRESRPVTLCVPSEKVLISTSFDLVCVCYFVKNSLILQDVVTSGLFLLER